MCGGTQGLTILLVEAAQETSAHFHPCIVVCAVSSNHSCSVGMPRTLCREPPEHLLPLRQAAFPLIHHTHAPAADLAEDAVTRHRLADWLCWLQTSTAGGDPACSGQSGRLPLVRTVFEGKQPQPLCLNSKKVIRTCARL